MFTNPKFKFLNPTQYQKTCLILCPINSPPCVILIEAKGYRLKIATPACHNKALRCAVTSLTLLTMPIYGSVKDER